MNSSYEPYLSKIWTVFFTLRNHGSENISTCKSVSFLPPHAKSQGIPIYRFLFFGKHRICNTVLPADVEETVPTLLWVPCDSETEKNDSGDSDFSVHILSTVSWKANHESADPEAWDWQSTKHVAFCLHLHVWVQSQFPSNPVDLDYGRLDLGAFEFSVYQGDGKQKQSFEPGLSRSSEAFWLFPGRVLWCLSNQYQNVCSHKLPLLFLEKFLTKSFGVVSSPM